MRRKKIKRISQQTHDSRQELAHFKYFYSCKRHTYLLLLSFPKVALFLFKTIKGLKKKKTKLSPKESDSSTNYIHLQASMVELQCFSLIYSLKSTGCKYCYLFFLFIFFLPSSLLCKG